MRMTHGARWRARARPRASYVEAMAPLLQVMALLLAPLVMSIGARADAAVDWLIAAPQTTSTVTETASTLTLSNGLTSRVFALTPVRALTHATLLVGGMLDVNLVSLMCTQAFGTIDWVLNATTARGGAQSMFRAVMPEGQLILDNTTFDIGGLSQISTFRAYCNRSELGLSNTSSNPAFRYVSHSVGKPIAPFPWTPGTRHSPPEYKWPPVGKNLAVTFAAPAASAYRDFKLTVHYEIYDGLPLISKWWTLERKPGWFADGYAAEHQQQSKHEQASSAGRSVLASVDSLGARPATPGTVGGWKTMGGKLTVQGDKLDLEVAPGGANAGAGYLSASDSMGATLGSSKNGGNGEMQSSIGLGLNGSDYSREDWEVMASCDAGGLYVGMKGGGRPKQITPCMVGDTIAIACNRKTKQATISVNGVAEGWLACNITADALFPRAQILAPSGYTLADLTPSGDLPPPPPPPPPAPPAVDAVVHLATVELFGAMPRFGSYPGHGSHGPGTGFGVGTTPNPLLQARTDQAHGAECAWEDGEPESKDSIPGCASCKDEGSIEPYLNCSYSLGPGAHVNDNETFVSFRVMSLATDSDEVERQALAGHRTTQLLAPHTTENPVFFHATDVSAAGFKATIDQMAEVGFEMLIFSFGSGFRLETADPEYLKTIKEQISYAHSKGIEVGGYDLICLDRGNPGAQYGEHWECEGDEGEACFASGWYDKLSYLVNNFISETGLSMLETDGPYGGDKCASHNHSHHHGLEDSVYKQTQLQSQFYANMRRLNVYVNQPDNYFFQGGSRTGMGYDEQQYSLPRWQDLSVSRMGMYDDLYAYLPTQGWMFLPITDYHAGGEAATFGEHIKAYEWGLAQYLGAGTAACYRGNRPYANDPTKAMVTKWISWYKQHRATLIHPIVHIRRADMQSWDGWLHVNPFGYSAGNSTNDFEPQQKETEVGVAMLFNPTTAHLNVTVNIPLYYTGLSTTAKVSVDGAEGVVMAIGRDYGLSLPMSMPANSIHFVTFARPNE